MAHGLEAGDRYLTEDERESMNKLFRDRGYIWRYLTEEERGRGCSVSYDLGPGRGWRAERKIKGRLCCPLGIVFPELEKATPRVSDVARLFRKSGRIDKRDYPFFLEALWAFTVRVDLAYFRTQEDIYTALRGLRLA